MPNFKEEITDILTPEGIRSGLYEKGQLLKFQTATIKITKLDKKNGRAWGEHVVTVNGTVAGTHEGHDVVSTGPGDLPFCNDCQRSINEPSTEDGEKKYLDRKDAENEDDFQTA